ncbi:MAG: glycine dehydrogenase (aminomethyl-transferring), partial [Bacteroidales bacterium]
DVDSKVAEKVRELAIQKNINFRYENRLIGISFDEAKHLEDAEEVLNIFAKATDKELSFNVTEASENLSVEFPEKLTRSSEYLDHPVFNQYHSEHEMLRYLKE